MTKKQALFGSLFLSIIILMESGRFIWADGLEEEMIPETPFNAPPPPLIEKERPISPPIDSAEPNEPPEAPAPPGPDFWATISKGMILSNFKPDGQIAASEDQKEMLGQGDIVYLTSNERLLTPNEEWVVYKEMREVRHPKTGTELGNLVHVLGVVKVRDVGSSVSKAEIVKSIFPISKKDKIASLDRFVPPPPQTFLLPEDGTEGTIVEARENRVNIAQHDIVYIDHGNEDGIIAGDRYVIIHGGERVPFGNRTRESTPENNLTIPYRKVGTMVVLATQERTATAQILDSMEAISKGDTILYTAE
ncbi:MAG: hypothetical protein ACE5GK_04965 [Nitrospiria bacterium]